MTNSDSSDEQVMQHELMIEGAGCASCVGKIESALKTVEGVVRAEMNFAQRMVSVDGAAPIEALIAAVEKAGYNAKAMDSVSDEDGLEAVSYTHLTLPTILLV